ncbi:MAG TPA: TonB-dependent receptor [Longimicrobiaceae bacterium]|jgi:outer membrane receptor protein involved in Fe transport|nr:TonB-dependent receptor [Longimicrobiaceae bacterium]
MKRLVGTLAALALAASAAAAQTPAGPPPGARTPPSAGAQQAAGGLIRGTVVDATTGRPVASASIAVRSARDSSLVTGAVTRPDGSFRIEGVRPGRYYVRVSSLGYTSALRSDVAVAPDAPQADLGTVRLAAGAVQLQAITATGERAAVSLAPDRNTYQARDIAATGGTASDVLRNVPSIEVDGDGKVSLRGDPNVAVQINGRAAPMSGDQLANFLKQLPASSVDKVEVIPNPSAKYDPDGMAGIVNIVLKQNADLGTSGGFQLGMGSGSKYNGGGNVGWQSGPVTLFGNYGFNADRREIAGFHFLENRFLEPRTFLQEDIDGTFDGRSHAFNGSGELKLGARDVLSTTALLNRRSFGAASSSAYTQLDATRASTGRYDRLTDGHNTDFTQDYSLAFKHTVQPQRNELSAEVRFNRARGEMLNDFSRWDRAPDGSATTALPDLQHTGLDALSRNVTAQADYVRGLGKRAKLETGYKGSLRRLDNDFGAESFSYAQNAWLPDAGQTNAFRYDERVNAAYGVLSGSMGRLDLQGGLRAERATTTFDLATTGQKYDNAYTSLFPSALAAFNLSDTRQVKASYSKRIQRPDTRLLNPFTVYEDAQNVIRGDPGLKPEYTHAFELGFQQSGQKGSLQVSPFFRHTVDAIRRVRTVDDAGITTSSFLNLSTSNAYGTDVNASLRPGGLLSGFAGVSVFHIDTDGSNAGVSTQATAWSARVNANVKVNPRLDAQAFYMYRAPMNVEGGRVSAFSLVNLSLRQKVMGEKGSVSLRLADPFNTLHFRVVTGDARYQQDSRRSMGMRAAYVTFQYAFGHPPRVRAPRPADPQQAPTDPGYGGTPGA